MFEKIKLTISERLILFYIKKKKKVKFHKYPHKLISYGLIEQNYLSEVNSIGAPIPEGTYSLTDFALRYRLYRKERYFEGKLPVIISIIALIGAYRNEIFSFLFSLTSLLQKFFQNN